MPRKVNSLSLLNIREVSSVDRPANPGAKIMLMKRALTESGSDKPKSGKTRPLAKTLFQHQEEARAAQGNKPSEGAKDRRGRQRHLKLAPAVEEYLKHEFSGKDRQRLAATGAAMPGGQIIVDDDTVAGATCHEDSLQASAQWRNT